jgi:hypothetical protein
MIRSGPPILFIRASIALNCGRPAIGPYSTAGALGRSGRAARPRGALPGPLIYTLAILFPDP